MITKKYLHLKRVKTQSQKIIARSFRGGIVLGGLNPPRGQVQPHHSLKQNSAGHNRLIFRPQCPY